jgi:hypothetical protein
MADDNGTNKSFERRWIPKRTRCECFLADVQRTVKAREARNLEATRFECPLVDVNEPRNESPRRRFQHGRFIADINVLEQGPSDAMSHEAPEAARTLYRRYQRAESGRGDAMDRRGTFSIRMRCRRCQRIGGERHGEATDHRGGGFSADAASQMSTRWTRAKVKR